MIHVNDIAKLAQKTQPMTVLYAEDDTDIRLTVTDLLSNLFHKVVSAKDGEEALQFYKQESFDLLITDIKMPKMNGIVLIEEIQKINKDQVCIITTAHDEKEYLDAFKVLNIKYVLQKPIIFDTLANTLHSIVD